MQNISAPLMPQPSRVERIDANAIRIDVERFADHLHVRLRPASVPAGVAAGPRVAIELDASSAHALGHALLRHAAALGVRHD